MNDILDGSLAGLKPLSTFPEIDGVFGFGDLLANGAMRAFQSSGRKVPEDVAVVGYNHIDLAGLVDPSLTTVAIPMYEIGRQAMCLLADRMGGKAAREEPGIFETSLVIHQRCGCAERFQSFR